MPFPYASLSAALIGLLVIVFAALVVGMRVRTGHSFGDGGDPALHRAIRAHGNLVEFAPILLILLAFMESAGASAMVIASLTGVFVLSRIAHGIYSFITPKTALRIGAFWGAALPIVLAAGWIVRSHFMS